MAGNNHTRFVGIIGDGGTDREVLGRITEVVLAGHCTVLPLHRHSIRDPIDKFWKECRTGEGCGFPGEPARRLSNAVTGVLYSAFDDFAKLMPRPPGDNDVIIVSSDGERHLDDAGRYFDDWCWILARIVQHGVERLCAAKVRDGCQWQQLPIFIPIVPFPSTDVVVAALRGERAFRGKSARQLKQMLYGTTNLRSVAPNEFAKEALDYVGQESIPNVYHHVPEARTLLDILAFARER